METLTGLYAISTMILVVIAACLNVNDGGRGDNARFCVESILQV